MLKIRFGESNLVFCEVMVRDLINSKRVHDNIQFTLNIWKAGGKGDEKDGLANLEEVPQAMEVDGGNKGEEDEEDESVVDIASLSKSPKGDKDKEEEERSNGGPSLDIEAVDAVIISNVRV